MAGSSNEMLQNLLRAVQGKQKLQVTVWDPVDEQASYTFPSLVMRIAGEKLMIAPPTILLPKVLPLMQPGLMICVVLETFPHPFMFYGKIETLPNATQTGYQIQICGDHRIELLQQRNHVRIPMDIAFSLEYLLPTGKWVPLSACTEDVSGGGLRFTSLRLFAQGQQLRLHVQFQETLPVLHLEAEVVLSTQNALRRTAEDLYSTSCKFHSLSEAQETLIVRECFRRELGLKH